jgi:hypothetical protein
MVIKYFVSVVILKKKSMANVHIYLKNIVRKKLQNPSRQKRKQLKKQKRKRGREVDDDKLSINI